MDEVDENVLRIVGGPYDGAEIDADDLLGGRLPGGLAIGSGGRAAYYDLDIDADGPLYRFTHAQGDAVSIRGAGRRRGESRDSDDAAAE